MPTDFEEQVPEHERQGSSVTNFPEQTIYTFAATSRILGADVTTLHKRARDGKLKTVNTPVDRRIHRDEIRRQCGESDENETGAQFEPAGERPPTGTRGSRPGIGDRGGDPTALERE